MCRAAHGKEVSLALFTRIFPILSWLPAYQKEWLRYDLTAGVTMAAVVIPSSMAFAAIAGLPLVVGLYTSLVSLVVYAMMGTSIPLSVTSTSTIAILTAGALGHVASSTDATSMMATSATLSLLVGAFLLLCGLLRIGVVANFISYPVLTGFRSGIGLIVVLDQLPKLLGVHIAKSGFFKDILSIVEHLPETSLPTLLFAIAMLVIMFSLKRFAPMLPAPLFTVAIGIAVSYFADIEKYGISLVGGVQPGLPLPVLPSIALIHHLWPAALGIALMSFVETAAAGRAFIKHGDQLPDANQEMVATGVANLVGSLFHIMPAGGGTSQTAVNFGAGARSQISGVVASLVVVATLLFLAPLFALMPYPTLAAIVVISSAGLISQSEFRAILKIRSMEFRWSLFALVGVLLLGTLKGILAAALISLLAIIIRANLMPLLVLGRKPGTNIFRPVSPEHPEDEAFPGLLLIRPEGSIWYANAPRIGNELRGLLDRFNPRALILDFSAVPDLEFTALRMLIDGEERLRERGTMLLLVSLNPAVLTVVQRSLLWERLGRERICFTLEQAVEKSLENHGNINI